MKSNNIQEFLVPFTFAVDQLQFSIKRLFFKIFLKKLSTFSVKLYRYIGRESRQQTERFMRADTFTPDNRKAVIAEDRQTSPRTGDTSTSKKIGSVKRVYYRGQSKPCSSSFSHSRRSMAKIQSNIGTQKPHSSLVPLENSHNESEDELKQEDEEINNFRMQRTRRQFYKSQMLQAQKANIFKAIDRSITGLVVNSAKLSKKKKEKITQVDHFVSMQVLARDIENLPEEQIKKTAQKAVKTIQAKTQRAGKESRVTALATINNNYQQLKHDQKLYLLNIPNQLKLSPGVTFRDHQKLVYSLDTTLVSGTTRKKLQFLKNQEMNPLKIKMSELMSFKKITTSTHLAYCSSMKTFKDIPKEGTQSKISIDSRTFFDDPNPSKRLIKIANKKIYEQMLVDIRQDGTEQYLKKGKIKPRKQGKVRFDPESTV